MSAPARPRAAPEDWPPDLALERIAAISQNARATWFALLGLLTFVLVTLLGVQDIDFFGYGRETQLPLVGVSVPTETFFIAAPILTTAVYAYFHFYLLKLWDALGRAPAKIDGDPLGERIHPWLLSDGVLAQRNWRQNDGCAQTRPLALVSALIAGFMTWFYGWAVLALGWFRVLPAHDSLLACVAVACGLFAVWVGLVSGLTANERGAKRNLRKSWRPTIIASAATLLLTAAAVPATWLAIDGDRAFRGIPALSWLALTPSEGFDHRLPLARPNLFEAHLTEKPADWLDRDTAEKQARKAWCARRDLDWAFCVKQPEDWQQARRDDWCGERNIADCDDHFSKHEAEFQTEWSARRADYLSVLKKPDLEERDLRGAILSNAFLPDVDLERARMEGAHLSGARMEGANLWSARMDRAHLWATRMEGAILIWAQMEGTVLIAAKMEGADLAEAQMKGADLREANMEGADLRGVNMEGADLSGANLRSVDLSSASIASPFGTSIGASLLRSTDFTGAVGLDQDMLADAIGDGDTILPTGYNGVQLFVMSCWAEAPSTLGELQKMRASFSYGNFSKDWLCAPGEKPRRTGQTECGVPITDDNWNRPELLKCPEGG